MTGTVLSVSTRALLESCVRLGIDADAVLAASGVPRAVIDDPDARLTREKQTEIWRRAYQVSGDPDLALHAAEALPIGAYRVVDYLAVNAPTVGLAVTQVAAYFPIINSAVRLPIHVGTDEVTFMVTCPEEPASVTRPYCEYTFAAVFQRIRDAIGFRFPLRSVEMTFPAPPSLAEHERIFGCKVRFGAEANVVRISREVWDRPNTRHDPGLFGVLSDHARTVSEQAPSDPQIIRDVRRAIVEQLKGGAPTLETVAKQLAMSSRTLQRRLGEQGKSYADLLDDARAGAAKSYLTDRQLSVAEIAYLLGFAEQSSFNHAFKRWTGKAPLEYRKSA